MSETTEVRFHYAGEVRLDFPELDFAVVLKGRLKVEPGLRLPVRAYMLKGDVQELLHGKLQTNEALANTYRHSIQDNRVGEHRFGTLAVEHLEIKEVRTLSKEGKQPPDDWVFSWVRYASDGREVILEMRGGERLFLVDNLPREFKDLPKYAHINPSVIESLQRGCAFTFDCRDFSKYVHLSYIRFAPQEHLGKVAGILECSGSLRGALPIIKEGTKTLELERGLQKSKGYKQDDGKPDYNLLMRDLAPQVEQIVKVLHWGHYTKGYPRNGFRTLEDGPNRFMAATQRHLAAMAKDAMAKDSESGLPHAIHVIANQLMLLANMEDNK